MNIAAAVVKMLLCIKEVYLTLMLHPYQSCFHSGKKLKLKLLIEIKGFNAVFLLLHTVLLQLLYPIRMMIHISLFFTYQMHCSSCFV